MGVHGNQKGRGFQPFFQLLGRIVFFRLLQLFGQIALAAAFHFGPGNIHAECLRDIAAVHLEPDVDRGRVKTLGHDQQQQYGGGAFFHDAKLDRFVKIFPDLKQFFL
jgi:hypothetical protein